MPSFLRTRTCAIAISLCSAWGAAHADYIWLAPAAGGAIEARAGTLEKPAAQFPDVKNARAFARNGQDVAVTRQPALVSIAGPAKEDVRYTAGVAHEGKSVTLYHAKWGRSETKALSDLELVPTEPGGQVFKLVWKGQPVAASQVQVDTSAGWRRALKPAADGSVHMETPFPGLYVLEVTAKVNGSVVIDGVKYEDVRHTATLSFEVPR